jgi:hypothetical protein
MAFMKENLCGLCVLSGSIFLSFPADAGNFLISPAMEKRDEG